MSKRPTGTVTDEDRLVALEANDEPPDSAGETGEPADAGEAIDRDRVDDVDPSESSYAVDVTALLERLDADLGPGTVVDWGADEEGDPMLVFGPLDEGGIDDAAYPRRCYERDGDAYVPVPDRLLRAPPGDGIGLDLESYDPSTPLLFDSVATDVTVGLVPVRFADGTPYGDEPLPDAPERSDPVAEAVLEHDETTADGTPRPETVDAPVDPDVLEETVGERDLALGDLADVLETIERRDLVGEADAVGEYPPISADDRAILVVPDDFWERTLEPQLEAADPGALEAATTVHERQARRLIEAADAPGYADALASHDVVVSWERDTAEWETTEPGSE